MSWIKNIAIIVIIFIAPLLILDAYFLYGKLSYRTQTSLFTCDRNLTNYDYCPSITHLNYLSLADKWLPVVNFIDKDRMSTYKASESPMITKKKRIFLIGDSFIQAEEMEINSRFEHYLRKNGYEVIAIGYSGWNSVQFHSIIKTLKLNKNDYIFVFSMGNDFTPSIGRSSIKTLLDNRKDEIKTDSRSLIRRIYHNSMIVNTLRRAKNQFSYMLNNKDSIVNSDKQIKISHDDKNWSDCASIPTIANVASELVLDYIYLSKKSKCWSENIKNSVDYNVKLLKKMQKIVKEQGAAFNIAFIPNGWNFKNQSTLERMSKGYLIPNNVVVSHVGLLRYLQRFNLPILDLEAVLKQHETSNANDLYFPADSHWNESAHKIIGKHLEGYILKIE